MSRYLGKDGRDIFKALGENWIGGLRKTMKFSVRISSKPTEIRIGFLPDKIPVLLLHRLSRFAKNKPDLVLEGVQFIT